MIRLLTYNIRAALGTDGARSLPRIAAVIAQEEPDVVALQEVDFVRARSGLIDQSQQLGDLLHAKAIPGPSFADGHGSYGNAVLSRHPAELVRHERLPGRAGTEPRSAMWVRIDHPEGPLHVVNSHLTFRGRERRAQIDALLGPRWLGDEALRTPFVVCGDLNCSPRDRGFRLLLGALRDACDEAGQRPQTTWPTRRPFRRIDHILVSAALTVQRAGAVRNPISRIASDHYPVVADLAR